METTIIGYIFGFYWDNGKQNGIYYTIYNVLGVYGRCPKLLHNEMTPSRESKVPFAHTIASFRGNMFEAKSKPRTLKRALDPCPQLPNRTFKTQSMPER